MGAWTDRDMAPDDALLHRLLDELERTNKELDEVKGRLHRVDDVESRLRQVDLNVARLDTVEELANKLQRRIEGDNGLSDRVAILFDAASKAAEANGPSKAERGLLLTLVGLLGAIVVELIRVVRVWLGVGP